MKYWKELGVVLVVVGLIAVVAALCGGHTVPITNP